MNKSTSVKKIRSGQGSVFVGCRLGNAYSVEVLLVDQGSELLELHLTEFRIPGVSEES